MNFIQKIKKLKSNSESTNISYHGKYNNKSSIKDFDILNIYKDNYFLSILNTISFEITDYPVFLYGYIKKSTNNIISKTCCVDTYELCLEEFIKIAKDKKVIIYQLTARNPIDVPEIKKRKRKIDNYLYPEIKKPMITDYNLTIRMTTIEE